MIELNVGESLVENKPGGSKKYEHKLKQITFLDKRVYERSEGLYYPSVTSILSSMPADPFFLQWLGEVGNKNAEIVRDRAAHEGSLVHEGIEKLLLGEKIDWLDSTGNARYNLQVWRMLLKFQDFYSFVKPETLASEMFLYSDTYQYAGTMDYLCRVGNETWLVDFKSSNHCGISYDCQLAAYAKALEEVKGIKVDRCGVLWLKAGTRTRKLNLQQNICQGEGWQLLFVKDVEAAFDLFRHVHEIYKILNPKIEPYTVTYPVEISLS